MGQKVEFDFVVLERFRVLAKAEAMQPCRNVTHPAAS
jgi:hypothetical protein